MKLKCCFLTIFYQQAQELNDWDKPFTFQVSKKPREEWFKEILDGKTAYNLRHTFATICQQYVRPISSIYGWAIHRNGLLERFIRISPTSLCTNKCKRWNFPSDKTVLQPKLQPKGYDYR